MAAVPRGDEVQVWVWRCDSTAVHASQLATLSDAERERAVRFVFERDRLRFVAAHAGLRYVLGGLLGVTPPSVALTTDVRGKPRIAGLAAPPLFFNLSHSGDLAAVAVSSSFEVGLDIERLREIEPDDVVAFFSETERATIAGLSGPAQRLGVFQAWTRKEAFVKATGFGLSLPLDSFDVSLAPGEPARLLRLAGAASDVTAWQLEHIAPEPGYVGAVAARKLGWHVTMRTVLLECQDL